MLIPHVKKVKLIELLKDNGNNPNPKPKSVLHVSYGNPFVQYFQCFD